MRRVDKPWGHEVVFAETDDYVGKILHVEEGHQLSLQYHRVKDETLYVASGRLEMEVGPEGGDLETRIMEPGDVIHIAPGTVHRMRALATCDIFEVSTPHLDDVVRLDDRYGRAGTSDP